ncbi:hypothetical protein GCM10023100_44960 [Actinocorallia cavernae]|uniref:Uncharacterized protein n=2 Tax=Actinomycetes TaxID=1760 RepID=A0ABP8SU42_9ACTN
MSYNFLHWFKAARSAHRAARPPAGPALLSPPRSSPAGARAALYSDQPLEAATLARALKITAPTSYFTGQVHRLPDAPEAYGAVITRAKAAPAQSRSADLTATLRAHDAGGYGHREPLLNQELAKISN